MLGHPVHCSMPIEQFRIERFDPAMCCVFWTLSRKALSAVLISTKLIGPPKNTATYALLRMKAAVPTILQHPALGKEKFNMQQ